MVRIGVSKEGFAVEMIVILRDHDPDVWVDPYRFYCFVCGEERGFKNRAERDRAAEEHVRKCGVEIVRVKR